MITGRQGRPHLKQQKTVRKTRPLPQQRRTERCEGKQKVTNASIIKFHFLASNISHICFLSFCLDICAHLTHFQGNSCGEWVAGVEKLLFSAHSSLILGLTGKKDGKLKTVQKPRQVWTVNCWSVKASVTFLLLQLSSVCIFNCAARDLEDVQLADIYRQLLSVSITDT